MGFETGEAVHGDDLDTVPPGWWAFGEPSLERLFGTALDHVEQPSRAGAVADRGQVDDHGDVLVAATGVPPDVLIHANDGDAVEPARVVDQDALAFGEDGVVGGVPRHPEPVSDPGDGEVLHHQALQRPPQPAAGQLRPRLRRLARVLPPHMPASGAAVAADRHLQRGRSPAERLVRQPADHGVAGTPWQPHRRHQSSGSTTRQASTARSGSRRCPVTTSPSSSSRQNTVRSGQPKPASGVASARRGLPDGECGNFHLRETSTPTRPATRRPATPSSAKRFPNGCQAPDRGHGGIAVPPLPHCGSVFVEVNVVRPATVICDARRAGAPR